MTAGVILYCVWLGKKPFLKGQFMKKIGIAVAAILVVIAIVLLFPRLRGLSVADILNFTPASLWLASLVFLGIYCIKTLLMFIPLVVLFLAAGHLFPTGWAIVLTLLCLGVEMSLGYWVGHLLGVAKVRAAIAKWPKAQSFFNLVQRNRTTACFFTRLIPMPVPLDLVSMFYGAVGVPYPQYILFSLLGVSGFMLPYVIAGEAIDEPLSPDFIVPFIISIAVSVVAFVVFRWAEKRRKAKAGPL